MVQWFRSFVLKVTKVFWISTTLRHLSKISPKYINVIITYHYVIVGNSQHYLENV